MANSNDIPEGYKATKLEELPDGWDIKPLSEIISFRKGRKPNNLSETPSGNSVPYLTAEYFRTGRSSQYVDLSIDSSAISVTADDVVFIWDGSNAGDVFFGLNGVLASTMTVIRADQNVVLNDWIYYVLKTNFQTFNNQTTGSTIPHVNKNIFLNLPVPLPHLPEQHAIATTLRTVQEAKEKTDNVIAATKALKVAMMKHLFTYGPVPPEQAEKIELQNSDFGSFPKKWRLLPLDECAYVQTGATKGKRFSDDDAIEVPYLRVANVQDGYLDLSEMKSIRIKKNELNRFSLKKGDVVVTEGGDFDKLGRGFIWQGEIPVCVHQNHIFAVRPDPDMVLPEYLAFLIQSEYGKKYFVAVAHRTTHLACINSTKLKALPVLIPTLSEQRIIVDVLSTIDQKLAAEQSRKEALDTLFASLLHDLMTAKIRVNTIAV